jgi:[ribosomal protein S5]-alanine N-acetyltransferase
MNEMSPLDLSRFFEQHPILETERLILRPISMDDADATYAYAIDPVSSEFMPWEVHRSMADTIAYLETIPKDYAARERISFAMVLKSTGEFIGSCGFHHILLKHHSIRIGYLLIPSQWGKGYMTEAVREMIRFAFDEMGMHRVEATCDYDNIRSARVMERCGMTLEGVFRDHEVRQGKFVSTKSYAIIKGN